MKIKNMEMQRPLETLHIEEYESKFSMKIVSDLKVKAKITATNLVKCIDYFCFDKYLQYST